MGKTVKVIVETWDFGMYYNDRKAEIEIPAGVSEEAFNKILEQINALTDDHCGARIKKA